MQNRCRVSPPCGARHFRPPPPPHSVQAPPPRAAGGGGSGGGGGGLPVPRHRGVPGGRRPAGAALLCARRRPRPAARLPGLHLRRERASVQGVSAKIGPLGGWGGSAGPPPWGGTPKGLVGPLPHWKRLFGHFGLFRHKAPNFFDSEIENSKSWAPDLVLKGKQTSLFKAHHCFVVGWGVQGISYGQPASTGYRPPHPSPPK